MVLEIPPVGTDLVDTHIQSLDMEVVGMVCCCDGMMHWDSQHLDCREEFEYFQIGMELIFRVESIDAALDLLGKVVAEHQRTLVVGHHFPLDLDIIPLLVAVVVVRRIEVIVVAETIQNQQLSVRV